MPTESPSARSAARKLLRKVDRAVNALEELRQARAQLSLEAAKPPLQVVSKPTETPGNGK
jgi:hypothetical protein